MMEQWQIDQGSACGCKGHDEMCPCQNVERSNWFVERRIDWIAETMRVFGFINRRHLERKFGISTPQAAKDLGEFQRRFPDAIKYDRSRKMYIANSSEERGDG